MVERVLKKKAQCGLSIWVGIKEEVKYDLKVIYYYHLYYTRDIGVANAPNTYLLD